MFTLLRCLVYLLIFFFFSLAEASPFKEGDESSVDIYDGLDNGLTVPGGYGRISPAGSENRSRRASQAGFKRGSS